MCGTAGTHSDSYHSYYTTMPALQVSSPGHRKGKNNLSRFTQLMGEKACAIVHMEVPLGGCPSTHHTSMCCDKPLQMHNLYEYAVIQIIADVQPVSICCNNGPSQMYSLYEYAVITNHSRCTACINMLY